MPSNWRDKQARSPRTLMAHAVLRELQAEAAYERALARFEPDDDTPRVPELDALSSSQSRRIPVEIHQ